MLATLVKLSASSVTNERAYGSSAIQHAMSNNATSDIPRSPNTGLFRLPTIPILPSNAHHS